MEILSFLISAFLFHETLGVSVSLITPNKLMELGFAPNYDPITNSVFAVDLQKRRATINRTFLKCNKTISAEIPNQEHATSIIQFKCNRRKFLVAVGAKLGIAIWDGKSGTASLSHFLLDMNPTGNPDHHRMSTVETDPTEKRVYLATYSNCVCGGRADNAIHSYSKKEGKRIRARGFKAVCGFAWHKNMMYVSAFCANKIVSFKWDRETGDLTHRRDLILSNGPILSPIGFSIDGNGWGYTVSREDSHLYKIDLCNKRIEDAVKLPTPYAGTMTIGGPTMDKMIIMSSVIALNLTNGKICHKPHNNENGGKIVVVSGFVSKTSPKPKFCHQ